MANRNNRKKDDFKGYSALTEKFMYDEKKNVMFWHGWVKYKGTHWSVKVFQTPEQFKKKPLASDDARAKGYEWTGCTVVFSAPLEQTIIRGGAYNVTKNEVKITDWNWLLRPKSGKIGYHNFNYKG